MPNTDDKNYIGSSEQVGQWWKCVYCVEQVQISFASRVALTARISSF